MSVPNNAQLLAYTATFTKISDAIDSVSDNHKREIARERVRNSLQFYRALVNTSNFIMQEVSFEAAVRELKAVADYLKTDGVQRIDWNAMACDPAVEKPGKVLL